MQFLLTATSADPPRACGLRARPNKEAIPGKTGSKGRPVLDPAPKLADLGVCDHVTIFKAFPSKVDTIARM
jgi:hypothetical protein